MADLDWTSVVIGGVVGFILGGFVLTHEGRQVAMAGGEVARAGVGKTARLAEKGLEKAKSWIDKDIDGEK